MYSVSNPGQFPVFIRDLQLYVPGGKTIDLDKTIRRDTSNRSTDLEKLLRSKKILLVAKDGGGEVAKVAPRKARRDEGGDKRDILELKKGMLEIIDLLKSGSITSGGPAIPQHMLEDKDPETLQKIAELQANAIANKEVEKSTNFDKIGKESTSDVDDLDSALDALDNLDGI
jgi:hypothetical protein